MIPSESRRRRRESCGAPRGARAEARAGGAARGGPGSGARRGRSRRRTRRSWLRSQLTSRAGSEVRRPPGGTFWAARACWRRCCAGAVGAPTRCAGTAGFAGVDEPAAIGRRPVGAPARLFHGGWVPKAAVTAARASSLARALLLLADEPADLSPRSSAALARSGSAPPPRARALRASGGAAAGTNKSSKVKPGSLDPQQGAAQLALGALFLEPLFVPPPAPA